MQPSRRLVGHLCMVGAVLLLSTTGCLALVGYGGEDVTDRALAAEAAHLTEQLTDASCVDGWGLTSEIGQTPSATIADRSDEGTVVEVTQPFWYSTVDGDDADLQSQATYLVTDSSARRLDGSALSPCRDHRRRIVDPAL